MAEAHRGLRASATVRLSGPWKDRMKICTMSHSYAGKVFHRGKVYDDGEEAVKTNPHFFTDDPDSPRPAKKSTAKKAAAKKDD